MTRLSISSVKLADYLAATIIVLVPFHAFLTVWASTVVGHFVLLRLWDELLLAALVAVVIYWLVVEPDLRKALFKNALARLIAAYIGLTLSLGIIAWLRGAVTPLALGYSLIVTVRFLVWFLAVWIVAQRSAWLKDHWTKLVIWPFAVVVIFGLMQFFVWPTGILANFGYGNNTYAPYLTINQDDNVQRIQATLRGANQLGVYAAAVLTLIAASYLRRRNRWLLLLGIGGGIVLVLTFSRSGWVAALLGAAVVLVATLRLRWQRTAAISALAALAVILAAGLAFLRINPAAQDFVFHVSDHTTASQSSNEQHASAFSTSLAAIAHEPLGRGPGTSGQASWYNSGHPLRNTESYLLQLGEETGVVGLGLFAAILVVVGRQLWQRRSDPLSQALLASLIAITLISLVTYSWADDTLAFIWWGLAAIAIAGELKLGEH